MIKRFIVILFVMSSAYVFAQDPQFTQFYASPLYLNPAFAGSTKCPRLTLNYRDQWPALKGTFVTTAASYDQYVDALGGGVGILIMNDKAGLGSLTTTGISGMYSYQLNISRTIAAKIGLQGTLSQIKYDWFNFQFGDMISPRYGFVLPTNETFPSNTKLFPDFSTGFILYSANIYGGFAVNHLFEPDEAFFSVAKLPRKYTAHIGGVIPLGKDKRNSSSYIAPNILFQQQQDFNQLNLGAYLGKNQFVVGLWYRTSVARGQSILGSDSFIALVGIQQGIFKFGYSYDITVSKLANASAGSHELSLGMQFECRPKKKKFRAIKCPTF